MARLRFLFLVADIPAFSCEEDAELVALDPNVPMSFTGTFATIDS